ncbi:MAG: AsmA family protein [Elusimicrobia bacterium]|nr:AsmA family protein [Elusimicrobiota bacterium]
MKKFLWAAAAGLVLLAAAVVVVSVNLGRIITAAVEAAGPRVLGAPVTLTRVSLSPLSGRGTLEGLVIGNPDGFKTPSAVRVGSVQIAVRLSSLMTDTIVVERVAVAAPELTWEIGPGGSNLTRLRDNAEHAAASQGGVSADAKSPAAPAKPGKSLLIKDFSVTGGKVSLAAAALGGRELSVALPDVHLKDLGGPRRSPAEVAAQALSAVEASARGAAQNAGGQVLEQARGAVLSVLNGLLDKAGK